MIKRGFEMPTIFDMIYREYCRARLAEMRKQLLIPRPADESLDRTRIAATLPNSVTGVPVGA